MHNSGARRRGNTLRRAGEDYGCAARYRRSWNTGTSGLAAGILLISVTSSGGMVVIQSTHTMASNAAAAIVVSALLVNSGGSMVVLVAEDHPVL